MWQIGIVMWQGYSRWKGSDHPINIEYYRDQHFNTQEEAIQHAYLKLRFGIVDRLTDKKEAMKLFVLGAKKITIPKLEFNLSQ